MRPLHGDCVVTSVSNNELRRRRLLGNFVNVIKHGQDRYQPFKDARHVLQVRIGTYENKKSRI